MLYINQPSIILGIHVDAISWMNKLDIVPPDPPQSGEKKTKKKNRTKTSKTKPKTCKPEGLLGADKSFEMHIYPSGLWT